MRTYLVALLVFGLWTFLVFLPEGNCYFRDSPEFVLSAYFLDVAHPAGFPTYAMLANLLALVPIGPIAWRVNCFSCLIALLNIVLAGYITRALLSRIFNLKPAALWLGIMVSVCALILSPTFVKQLFTPEVYALNLLFVQIEVLLIFSAISRSDRRFFLLASFVGGIALGNHVSILIILAPIALLLIGTRRVPAQLIPSGLALVLCGLLVYGYVPMRALDHPPLNTGEASSPKRFFLQISDGRDFALRQSIQLPQKSEHTVRQSVFGQLFADLVKIKGEVSLAVLLFAAIGLLGTLSVETLMLAIVVIGNYLFFRGWDPDPFLPLIWAIGTLAAIACAWTVSKLKVRFNWEQWLSTALITFVIAISYLFNYSIPALERVSTLRDFSLPADFTRQELARETLGTVLLVDEEWFLKKFMREIEGVREDLILTYQPSLLFPQYFSAVNLTDGPKQFSSLAIVSDIPADTPNFKVLGEYVGFSSGQRQISISPNKLLDAPLSKLLILDNSGRTVLERGKLFELQPNFIGAVKELLSPLKNFLTQNVRHPASADTRNYFETKINDLGGMLATLGRYDTAIDLLEWACMPLESSACSFTSLNNLGVYLMRAERKSEAANIFKAIIERGKGNLGVVRYNLEQLKK